MTEKPTYGELAQRVRELEANVIEYGKELQKHKLAEDEQKKLQAQLSDALEMARLAPWEYDIEKDLFTFNDHFYRIFRTNAQEMGGYTMSSEEYFRRFVHPDDIPRGGRETLKTVEQADSTVSKKIEHRMIYADGTTGYMNVQFFIVKDDKGRTIKTYGVNQDITERKLAEERIRESEERFRMVLENLPGGVVMHELNGRFLYINDKTCQDLGYLKEEVYGKTVMDLDPKSVMEDDQTPLWYDLGIGKSITIETTNFRKDGTEFPCEVHLTAISLNGQHVILAIVFDITERKRTEEVLRESEEKLARYKKMESLGLLAGGVAHDLNNILAGIVSYPELLLLDLPEDSKYIKPIKTIQESGNRAVAIVQDLLTIARGVASTKETLNLNDIIQEYLISPEYNKLKQFHPMVTVRMDLEPHLLNMSCSPIHIRKVIMNLVSNASEAIAGSGNVSISTMNRYLDKPLRGYEDVKIGEYVVLTVKDDGLGISPEHLERIFEPFFTKKIMSRSGTGLGLAVVWNIVQDHEGYIDVLSDESGTTFELYFPITRGVVAIKDLSISINDCKGDGETILVVDDEEMQREIACNFLNTLNYKSTAVSTGEDAVEYLKEKKVDLILLDMIMDPGINGRETYERILEIRPNQKAIIVSGFSETDDVKEIQRLGAGPYIRKPLTLEKIGMAIKEELRKS